jgi:hypothetical protein
LWKGTSFLSPHRKPHTTIVPSTEASLGSNFLSFA